MRSTITAISLTAIFLSCQTNTPQEVTPPPYFSSKTLKEPIVFGEGQITTVNGICFSKNGETLYTSGNLQKQFDNGRYYAGIFESHFENGKWTKPKQVLFDIDIDAYHPVLSMDNELLFFNSRSHLDSANRSIPHNIWVAHQTSNGWSTPELVKGVNSAQYDSYPSIVKNNNLYFNSNRAGGKGGMDFYVSYFKNGQYQQPINLETLNSPDSENDLIVDPDERFIIFNRYIDATKAIDLYIAFRKGNDWTFPRKLDTINDSTAWELTPSLSPDGKYFFYELNNKIMQIELAQLIDDGELEKVGKR